MLKFPPETIVHKGNVFYLLYGVGGLLMTVTAGSRCVDVAVRTAQNPANLLRLSNTLIGLMGLRYQKKKPANSVAKQKLKRLFLTDSFNSLLDMMRSTLQGTHHFAVLRWFPEKQTNVESAHCVSAKRCGIYYILICVNGCQPVLTLRLGNNSKLKTYSPANQLQWLIEFSSWAQARGDEVFLLLEEQTRQISSGSDTNGATHERHHTSLTLVLSALSVVLLWMFLPHIAVFAAICLGWKVQQRIH
ncbi:uncharacterized protein LOC117272904 isoform X2 [Epinephelus lanceolatus]